MLGWLFSRGKKEVISDTQTNSAQSAQNKPGIFKRMGEIATRAMMIVGLGTGVAMLPAACSPDDTTSSAGIQDQLKNNNTTHIQEEIKIPVTQAWKEVHVATSFNAPKKVAPYESKIVTGPMTVAHYLETNFGVSTGWERLVDVDTGARVIDTTKDLKIGHFYVLTESTVEARKISHDIRHKAKDSRMVEEKKPVKSGYKTSWAAQGALTSTAKVSVNADWSGEKHAILQGPAIEQITQVTFPEWTDQHISSATKNTSYFNITPTKFVIGLSKVETASGQVTLNYIEKAKKVPSIEARNRAIRLAIRSQVWPASDVWALQITNDHLKDDIKRWENEGRTIDGPIIWNMKALKKEMKRVINEGIDAGKSSEEIFKSFEELDIRFRPEFYSMSGTDSFVRAHRRLGRYRLDPTTRVELSIDAWNKGEGWIMAVAAHHEKNGGTIESSLEALWYSAAYLKKQRRAMAALNGLSIDKSKSSKDAEIAQTSDYSLISSAQASEVSKVLRKDTPESILADVKKIKGTKKAKKVLAYVDKVEQELRQKKSLAVNDNGSKIQEEMSIERIKEDTARTQAEIKAKFGVVMTPAEELRSNIAFLSKKAQEGNVEARKALAEAEKMLMESEKAAKLLKPQNDITIEQIESEISKVVAYLPQFVWREDAQSKARALELKENIQILQNKKRELLARERRAA